MALLDPIKSEFTGSTSGMIDDRNRISLSPAMFTALEARIRSELGISDPAVAVPLNVVISWSPNGHCGIFTPQTFQRILDSLMNPENPESKWINAHQLCLRMMRFRDDQELDSQRRLRLPSYFRNTLKINHAVMVMGSGDYIEVNALETIEAESAYELQLLRRKAAIFNFQPEVPAIPLVPFLPDDKFFESVRHLSSIMRVPEPPAQSAAVRETALSDTPRK